MWQPAAVVPQDAAVPLDAAIDAAIDAGAEVDAPPPDAPPLDAPPLDARRPPPDAGRIALRPDAAAARPTGEMKSFTIGAVPWAYFTVDGDPKQYETPTTLRLTVGPHRVTFTNPQLGVSRTVTITVPPDDDGRHVEKMN